MLTSIYTHELPEGVTEEEFRVEFQKYLALQASTIPGTPKNFIRYEIFAQLDPNFTVLPDPLPQQIATLSAIFETAVNERIQQECTAAGFDDIHTARAYASTDNPLQAQSASFVNWTAAVWLYCRQYLEDVQNGVKPIPELADYMTTLPTRVTL